MARRAPVIVGIDTGGTFTDLVALIDGEVRVHKLLSTPDDPARAVLEGLKVILEGERANLVTYSSTVATNALLEKKGARVALFTNAGFEDLVEIGRQNRLELYALAPTRPEPLVGRAMRWGISERTLFDGTIALALSKEALGRATRLAARSRAESFAVCLLHSYANAASERALARALEPLGRPVSVSHLILPEYREYERLSTTVINAYVAPKMSGHIADLGRGLEGARLFVMQSDGGAIGAELAEREPVRTILSGPAAGVVGASALAPVTGVHRFITFDMGGTSTDVSLFDRRASVRTLSHPGGYAVRTPAIDIHTVGAGGGSIAAVDAGGSLRVGPQSAGAQPGPACYGRGTSPTVTDANLVAGRLVAENFLGGAMKLYPARAARALAPLARALRVDIRAAALGVIRVVNANMERALRRITVERGFNPRDFALVAFGGAGPMHAAELALALGIRRIVLARNPGLLCAWGALGTPLGREYSLTVMDAAPVYGKLVRRARAMRERALAELRPQLPNRVPIRTELWADIRYRGQSHEIRVPLSPRFIADFHAAHRRIFGHATSGAPVEVVNLRVVARARAPAPKPPRLRPQARRPAPVGRAEVVVERAPRSVPVYERAMLGAGARLRGPALVVELSATTYVAPAFTLRADDFGTLYLERGR